MRALADHNRSRSGARHATNLSWLVRLRWGTFASQVALVLLVARFSAVDLPVSRLLAILGFGLATNAVVASWLHKGHAVQERYLAGVLALDLFILTSLLYLTGGPFNPFTSLYLVHIALAPVVLGARWTWTLVGVAVGCFALLFAQHVWLPLGDGRMSHADYMRIHVKGMWIAFCVAAGFIAYFVRKVQVAMARQEDELARARTREARTEKLTALATLAAGAAHELSTPLSTIALAARELDRRIRLDGSATALLDDATLIREQVERCRRVLEQMAADAGATGSDALEVTEVAPLLHEMLDGVAKSPRIVVSGAAEALSTRMRVPVRSLAIALRGVVKNAQEASPRGEVVRVDVATGEGSAIVIRVRDQGPGMAPDVLARAGEPFFTTKGPGSGMGLGLFLARAVAEHLGGSLDVEVVSGDHPGTQVTFSLPREVRVGDTAARSAAPLTLEAAR